MGYFDPVNDISDTKNKYLIRVTETVYQRKEQQSVIGTHNNRYTPDLTAAFGGCAVVRDERDEGIDDVVKGDVSEWTSHAMTDRDRAGFPPC